MSPDYGAAVRSAGLKQRDVAGLRVGRRIGAVHLRRIADVEVDVRGTDSYCVAPTIGVTSVVSRRDGIAPVNADWD